jgi:hypothetical protein
MIGDAKDMIVTNKMLEGTHKTIVEMGSLVSDKSRTNTIFAEDVTKKT